jgi:hypothetical protein
MNIYQFEEEVPSMIEQEKGGKITKEDVYLGEDKYIATEKIIVNAADVQCYNLLTPIKEEVIIDLKYLQISNLL